MFFFLGIISFFIGLGLFWKNRVLPIEVEGREANSNQNLPNFTPPPPPMQIEVPNLWMCDGVKVIGQPFYQKPPIDTKGAELNIYHGAESINLYIVSPTQTTSIQIDYIKLAQYDLDTVLVYLKKQGIIK